MSNVTFDVRSFSHFRVGSCRCSAQIENTSDKKSQVITDKMRNAKFSKYNVFKN